jgi:hypothetical protein
MNSLRESGFDQAPAGGKIAIARQQPPQTVQMIGENHDGVDKEWMIPPSFPKSRAQNFDMPNQQIVSLPFRQVDGEEIATAFTAFSISTCYA